MAPPLRRSTAGTTGGSPDIQGAFTSPTGGVTDDVVLLRLSLVAQGAETPAIVSPPDGTWTEDTSSYCNVSNASPDHQIRTFVKRLTGNIAASYTFSWGAQNCYWQGLMLCYSGVVKTGTAVNTGSAGPATAQKTTADAPSITPTVADTELVYFGSTYNNAWTGTAPTGMTDGITSTNLYTADQDWATANTATGTRSTTASGSSDWTSGALIALAPDTGAAAAFVPRSRRRQTALVVR